MKNNLEDLYMSLLGLLAGVDHSKVRAMEDSYEERKVDAFEDPTIPLAVDTALVYDNDQSAPYETAVLDPRYGEDWIPVANSKDKEEAQKTHDHWVKIMTENPPEMLLDVGTAESALAKDKAVGTDWREKRRKV